MKSESKDITRLLAAWNHGDHAALDQLMPMVYGELRRLAHGYMNRQRTEHTLQTTALIHEAYLKLVGQPDKEFSDRAHFFGVAAQAMRHILVDYARARNSLKRGDLGQPISLDDAAYVSVDRAAELVALDDALSALAKVDLRKSQVVELRYFGGLSQDETAEILKVSLETVKRDWRLAKMWLLRELQTDPKATE